MSMAWEPDRRSNFFFSPPAHLCAVTCITEISLIKQPIIDFGRLEICDCSSGQNLKQLVIYNLGFIEDLRRFSDHLFQPYRDFEAGDNQSQKQVARPGIEPWTSCSASQELSHSATTAPYINLTYITYLHANGKQN